MLFTLFSDCQASAVRTFMSLSLEHVQLPRYLRLAALSRPQLFVYSFTINCLHFYTLNVDIHNFGLYCILYSHCVKASA